MLKCARMNTVGEIIIQYRNSYINKHQHTKGNTPNVFSKCVQQSLVFTVLYRHTIYYYCTKHLFQKCWSPPKTHRHTIYYYCTKNISTKNVEVLRRHIDTPSITNDQHLVSPPTLKRTDWQWHTHWQQQRNTHTHTHVCMGLFLPLVQTIQPDTILTLTHTNQTFLV